jgi:hypothetical protein
MGSRAAPEFRWPRALDIEAISLRTVSQGIDICDEAFLSRIGSAFEGRPNSTPSTPNCSAGSSGGNSGKGCVTAIAWALGTDLTQAASHEDEATWQGDDGNDRVRDPFACHWMHRQQFINEKHAAACSSALIRSVAGTPHRAARQDRLRKLGLYCFSSSSLAELPV